YFSFYILLGIGEEAVFGRRRRRAARAAAEAALAPEPEPEEPLLPAEEDEVPLENAAAATASDDGEPDACAIRRRPRRRPLRPRRQVLRRRRLGSHRGRRSRRLPGDHGVPPPRPLRRAHRFRPLPHLRRAQALAGQLLRPRPPLEERRRRGARRRLRRRLGVRAHLDRGVGATAVPMNAPIVEFIVTGDEVMRGIIA